MTYIVISEENIYIKGSGKIRFYLCESTKSDLYYVLDGFELDITKETKKYTYNNEIFETFEQARDYYNEIIDESKGYHYYNEE